MVVTVVGTEDREAGEGVFVDTDVPEATAAPSLGFVEVMVETQATIALVLATENVLVAGTGTAVDVAAAALLVKELSLRLDGSFEVTCFSKGTVAFCLLMVCETVVTTAADADFGTPPIVTRVGDIVSVGMMLDFAEEGRAPSR